MKQLLEEVGSSVARAIIQSHVVYPRSNKLKDETAIFEDEYSGSLKEILEIIEQSIVTKRI